MKIINKIRAFFSKENESVELDLVAAEIKNGRAFLHTREKETYMVKSNDIRISLSEGLSLHAKDVFMLTGKKLKEKTLLKENQKDKRVAENNSKSGKGTNNKEQTFSIPVFEQYKKRVFSVSLYPDEYDLLIGNMKEYGYKRADFLLACVHSAKKTSIEKAHKAIVKTHKQKLMEQKELIAQQLADLEKAGQTG